MKCEHCKLALPPGSSSRKRFCDDSHRARYWREQTTVNAKAKHTSAHSAPRIPMSEQLMGLAPEGALGYRLMIPTSTPDDMLRMSPPLDATGYQGHYSLCPFQAPYDIRLMDGQIYRVVWTGASGEVIPPKTDGAIPGLHFFLTSSASSVRAEAESPASDSVSTPGTESVKTEGSRSVTQTEVDTQRDGTPVLDPKQTTEALTLDEKLHAALGEKPIELIMPRIELLLCAGQFQEAKLLAEQMLAVSPLDLNSLTAVEQLIVELKQLGKDGSSPPAVVAPKPGRNQPCSCHSGKTYRRCCRTKGPQGAVPSAGRSQ